MNIPTLVTVHDINGIEQYTQLTLFYDASYVKYESTKLQADAVIWSDELLCRRHDVHRSGWAEWLFDSKEDAEKFRTLFLLRWS